MSSSVRRAAGLAAAIVTLLAVITYCAWRIEIISRRGWAGFSYVPAVGSKRALRRRWPGRLIELLIAHRHLGARELQARIIEQLREFTAGDFSDDVTLVVIAAR